MREYASRESKNLKSKMLGATSIQIGEDDVSRLVGGIVEKGFSEVRQTRPLPPPTGPRPTVLPFPLARHRSHGPVFVLLYLLLSVTCFFVYGRYLFFFCLLVSPCLLGSVVASDRSFFRWNDLNYIDYVVCYSLLWMHLIVRICRCSDYISGDVD